MDGAVARGTRIVVHTGQEAGDLLNARLLPDGVETIQHTSDTHLLTGLLKEQGALRHIVHSFISDK